MSDQANMRPEVYALAWILLAAIGGNIGMFLEWAWPYIERVGAAMESVRLLRPNHDAMCVLAGVILVMDGTMDLEGRYGK